MYQNIGVLIMQVYTDMVNFKENCCKKYLKYLYIY